MQQNLLKPCNCVGFCQNQHLSKNVIGKCGLFCKIGRFIVKIGKYSPYAGFANLVGNALGANNKDEVTPTGGSGAPGEGGNNQTPTGGGIDKPKDIFVWI
jgi:hypothetical protein